MKGVGETRGWRSFIVREGLLVFLAILAGMVGTGLIFYPDTEVTLGFGYLLDGGVRVPAVMVDFDTPTASQLSDFRSVDAFDRWAVEVVAAQLGKEGVTVSRADLRFVRVPDLSGSHPEKLIQYRGSWSGLKRLFHDLWPLRRASLLIPWATVLLPCVVMLLLRSAWWLIRVAARALGK
jgi:hypothetical protein